MNVEVKILNEMTAQEWCRLAEERIKVFVVELFNSIGSGHSNQRRKGNKKNPN